MLYPRGYTTKHVHNLISGLQHKICHIALIQSIDKYMTIRLNSLIAGVEVTPSNNHISLVGVDVSVELARWKHSIFKCQLLLCLNVLLSLLGNFLQQVFVITCP